MTAPTHAAAPAPRTDIRPISMVERVRTELRKLTNYRGGRILIWVTLILMVLFSLGFTLAIDSGERSTLTAITISFVPLTYIIPILAIMMSSDEWRQKTVMVTYVQDSHRTAVFAAKMIAALLLSILFLLIGAVIGLAVGAAFGASMGELGELTRQVGPILAGAVLSVLVGAGLGGATLSLPLGLVAMFVVGQIVPQILSIVQASASIAPYVNFFQPLTQMFAGAWPSNWTEYGVATALWVVIPLGIAMWRNGNKDIS